MTTRSGPTRSQNARTTLLPQWPQPMIATLPAPAPRSLQADRGRGRSASERLPDGCRAQGKPLSPPQPDHRGIEPRGPGGGGDPAERGPDHRSHRRRGARAGGDGPAGTSRFAHLGRMPRSHPPGLGGAGHEPRRHPEPARCVEPPGSRGPGGGRSPRCETKRNALRWKPHRRPAGHPRDARRRT